jgi:hypothetical protein
MMRVELRGPTILVFSATLLLMSCETGSQSVPVAPHYEIQLHAVERQQRGATRESFQPTAPNTFEDPYIKIVWQPQISQLGFTLTNKTDSSLRVLWDDASYVGPDGKTDRIMHEGIKFSDRSASMPPTLVIHGAHLDDLIAPTSNVYWQEGYGQSVPGSWQSRPLITSSVGSDASIKILLPFESNGAVREYLFDFAASSGAGATATSMKTSEIKIVRKSDEVSQCQLLGAIEAHPPYILPGDDFRQLRAKAAALGADTVLVPGRRIGIVSGQAYRCTK